MPKGTSRAEVTLNSEKIKPVTLAIIDLCLTEGITVSQKTIPLNKYIFHDNFLKAFWVNLKTCLGLVLPDQCHPSVF